LPDSPEPPQGPSRQSEMEWVRTRLRTFGGQQRRYGLLLLAIVTVFAIQGIATPEDWEQVLVTALLAATLLLALRVADVRPVVFRVSAAIVTAALVLSIVEAILGNLDHGPTRVANAMLVVLAPPAISIGVVRSLRARQTVTLEAVLGVLSVYLLIGMLFAFVYGAIDRFGSGMFFAQEVSATVSQCLYFSFTTLTTVGYGDLTARSNLGHTLAVSEALLGQIYLVTIVSLIVANVGRGRGAPQRHAS
jgi:Ion channel